MKIKGPIITLGAGLVIAGVLYVLNVDLSNDVARNNASASQKAAAEAAAKSPSAAASTTAAVDPPSTAPASSAPVGDGSGNAGTQGAVTYAGAVDGGAASLAIVVNDGKAIAYVCDGKTVEAWLEGVMANGQITLKGAKGSLTGTYASGQVKGKVAAGSKGWNFTMKTVAPPSGLYRSAASVRTKLDASWVVREDLTQVGVQLKNGKPEPAPPFDLNTKTITVDGSSIPIVAGDPNVSTSY